MSQSKLSLDQKKEYAEVLYCERHLNQNVAAKKVGVSTKTFSVWVAKFGWEKKRKRLLIGRDQQLTRMYDQLDRLNTFIDSRETGKNFPNAKESDTQVKITAAIRNLEIDLNIADKVKSVTELVKYVQKVGTFEEAMAMTDFCDSFIKSIIA